MGKKAKNSEIVSFKESKQAATTVTSKFKNKKKVDNTNYLL